LTLRTTKYHSTCIALVVTNQVNPSLIDNTCSGRRQYRLKRNLYLFQNVLKIIKQIVIIE
jgi:hypothetical protein